MKKELIICIIIVALIIITNIITQNYTKECVNQMNQKLDILKEASLSKNIDEKNIESSINDIEQDWNKFQEKLAFYIEHDELEKVETQIFAMKGFSEIKKYDEVVPELEKCIFILDHIKEKTTLNVKNVF